MDSFETNYTYFLGQSPNFVLFRIWKFGFSDFLWIFIKIHWNCYFCYIFQSILLKLGTLVSWVSPQTLFFSEFWNLDFLIFHEFSSNFPWNRYCFYSFQWIPLKLGTLILWISLHIFADFSKFVFFYFPNFHTSFIQIATAPTIFNGFLWNSHGEDGLSCRPCLKFSGAI